MQPDQECASKNFEFQNIILEGDMSQLKNNMNLDTRVLLKVEDETKRHLLEITKAEKQLLSSIYSKGLLHKEVRELYRKVCSKYEKIIVNDQEEVQFQEIEYSLWKLHYRHIHEFRKKISQKSKNTGYTEPDIDSPAEKYKLFLTEATEFYQNLIVKIEKFYGFEEKGGLSHDLMKLHKCQYIRHRFLVCLGDLARYRELCNDTDVQRCNWSVAATNYFKAASSWPDSGNPQNQLAVLAKYIGDDFLALYHCIRSLAVKEPFPDARNNFILLLEENRSSHLESLSRKACFNFLNPSEKSAPPHFNPKNNYHISSAKSAFWSLFVRLISLLFIETSLEEFPYTFASTLRELEFLLELNDIELSASLESYQQMDPNRSGPYRALQFVCILVFVINSLTTTSNHKESKVNTNLNQLDLVKSALTATFTILGRITKRCVKGNLVTSSPLLPAVLVFVEWLSGMFDTVQEYTFQKEVACALSYFLDTFVELLNQFETLDKFKLQNEIALWEDYELRGFVPMARSFKLLNLICWGETMGTFVGENSRVCRIFDAAIKIVEKRPIGFEKWISYDAKREKFFTNGQLDSVDFNLKEPQHNKFKAIKEIGNITEKIVIEEEEEIIFKPFQRYNSAPVYLPEKETSTEGVKDKIVLSEDSLRRATSLFSNPYPAGPPSLNAWVLDNENIIAEKEKATREFFKPQLCPFDELGSFSLIDSTPYSAPIPSAPLLPEDAILLCENSDIHDMNSPMRSHRPSFDGRLSFTPMSSSEWLHQFRNQNLNRGNHFVHPTHCRTPGNLYRNEASITFTNRWGLNSLNYNQIMSTDMGYDYQGLNPYRCDGDIADVSAEKPPFLLYLNEKEWQLHNQARVRGPAYMGN